MKTIYLHMGFHKTATSSFQETCKRNVNELTRQGFVYPLFNSKHINIKENANHSAPIYSLFTNEPQKYHFNVRQEVNDVGLLNRDYLSYLEECITSDKDLILSGEAISVLPEDRLIAFRLFLESFQLKIMPIVSVRTPFDFHCTNLQQQIKAGYYGDFAKFQSQIGKIKRIKKVFPETKFIPFNELCKHKHGPVGFILDLIGVEYFKLEFVKVNESVGNLITRSQNELNKKEPILKSGSLNKEYVNIIGVGIDKFKEKFTLSKDEYLKIKKEIDDENEFFSKTLGAEFQDAGIKYSNKNSVFEEMGNYLSSGSLLNEKYVDTIRNAALVLERDRLELAHQLMELAHIIRPKGPVIKSKLDEYRSKLAELRDE